MLEFLFASSLVVVFMLLAVVYAAVKMQVDSPNLPDHLKLKPGDCEAYATASPTHRGGVNQVGAAAAFAGASMGRGMAMRARR